MALPDWYTGLLKDEIVRLKAVLEPLESGKVHIGDRDGDRTQNQIHAFKRSIAELEALVDEHHA